MEKIRFDDLPVADLFVDAVYESNGAKNLGGDVLNKLLSVGNQGGFRRKVLENDKDNYAYIVLESTKKHSDWIDSIDKESGLVQYYGDNREPGRELHKSGLGGNKVLKKIYEDLQSGKRKDIPPFFLFESENGRNRRFLGLVAPGSEIINPEQFLVAIWRTKKGQRYQNYKAVFTILDTAQIKREWINDLLDGKGYSSIHIPAVWKKWVDDGKYIPLCAKDSVLNYRTREQQEPDNDIDKIKLKTIYDYFTYDPYQFEYCAMKIVQLMDSNIHDLVHTRFVIDGGRDAIGKYRIGKNCDGVDVEFALEAKHHEAGSSVGVREVARAISRLRYRQFGILVTTSFVGSQAYKEIKEDGHPLIIVSGADIIRILYESGIKTNAEVKKWLMDNFPKE